MKGAAASKNSYTGDSEVASCFVPKEIREDWSFVQTVPLLVRVVLLNLFEWKDFLAIQRSVL